MLRFRFEFMDKSRKEEWLPRLFEILHENMDPITPSGLGYDEDRTQWLSAVLPAVEKAPRQIVLMFAGNTLAGFFQYYVNGNFFMVEELQIDSQYQGTTLLYSLIRFLCPVLPGDAETIGAYAHKKNLRSQNVIQKLGLEKTPEKDDGDFEFYRGDLRPIKAKLCG